MKVALVAETLHGCICRIVSNPCHHSIKTNITYCSLLKVLELSYIFEECLPFTLKNCNQDVLFYTKLKVLNS